MRSTQVLMTHNRRRLINAAEQKNLETARRFYSECLNDHKLDVIPILIADEIVLHPSERKKLGEFTAQWKDSERPLLTNTTLKTLLPMELAFSATARFHAGCFQGQSQIHRTSVPRISGATSRFEVTNLEKNVHLVGGIAAARKRKENHTPQLCIAWVMAQRKDIVTLVGSDRPDSSSRILRQASLSV